MSIQTSDKLALRVFVSDNTVWYEICVDREVDNRIKTARPGSMTLAEFVASDLLREARRIHLVGNAANARLICSLYEQRVDGLSNGLSVYIGSKAGLNWQPDTSPAERLFQMQQIDRLASSSCGGWHELTRFDYATYGLIRHLQSNDGHLAHDVLRALTYHPAWPAISFIPTINENAVTRLICEIVDPRWYIDPAHPNRPGRLHMYLGLHPSNMRAILNGQTRGGKNYQRAKLTWAAWAHGSHPNAAMDAPESFLWRYIKESKDAADGLLAANVAFVTFIRQVWLATMAPKGRVLFVPELFFRRPIESDAYAKHLHRLGAQQRNS